MKLKACPFCGGEAKVIGVNYLWVECLTCYAQTMVSIIKSKAIKLWNRRVRK